MVKKNTTEASVQAKNNLFGITKNIQTVGDIDYKTFKHLMVKI